MDTLQEESTITLNAVDSVDEFVGQMKQGKWDQVLQTLIPLRLPASKLMDLYEHIIVELVEMGEVAAAKSLLRETEPMDLLKENYQDRYLNLEDLLVKPSGAKDGYLNGKSKEKRRKEIAEALIKEIHAVPANRLLCLLGQAMKWQRYQGMLPTDAELSTGHYDLFRNAMPETEHESFVDMVPSECYNIIKFSKKQHPESVAFSPDGTMLALGSVDGIIEIYSHETGRLRKDLKYQADGELMIMDTAVLCLSFAKDSEHLASGSQDGKIFLWRARDGALVRKFSSAHPQGVTCLCFNGDGSQILSGGFDSVVRCVSMSFFANPLSEFTDSSREGCLKSFADIHPSSMTFCFLQIAAKWPVQAVMGRFASGTLPQHRVYFPSAYTKVKLLEQVSSLHPFNVY